ASAQGGWPRLEGEGALTKLLSIVVAFIGLGIALSGRAANPEMPRSLAHPWAATQPGPDRQLEETARTALPAGNYPWYERGTDRLRPIWPPRRPWLKWIRERSESAFKAIDRWLRRFNFGAGRGLGIAGESIGSMLLMTVLIAFFVALVVIWARRDRMATDGAD